MSNISNDTWKETGYEGYLVSNTGKVYSIKAGRNLKPGHAGRNSEYECVVLSVSNKKQAVLIHRLVAEAFVPNLLDKKFVHHKDNNGSNNNAENLAWATPSENTKQAYKAGSSTKILKALNFKSSAEELVFKSHMDAARHFGVVSSAITKAKHLGKFRNYTVKEVVPSIT